MARFGEINAQYFDDGGDPLGSGKLYFYESGTTTAKDTFSDINLTIPNTNPVILTAAGRQPNIFFNGNAKGILTDKNDVQILVRDPIGETGTNFGDAWVATTIYSANAVVIGSDGVYYRSLANGNQNNNPTTTSGFWTLLYSIQWSSGITYSAGDIVLLGTTQFQSLQDNNLNQNPATQTAFWVSLAFAWVSTSTYSIHQNVVGPDGILYTSLQNSNIGNVPASSGSFWVGTSAAAAASATASANSASASASSASSSQTSATASETAKDASVVAKDASVVAKDASVVAKNQAETAKTAAETAQTAAETAKTGAETAETNSANSATASAGSATASSNSAAAALVSQNAAAVSATAAASSESAVATDAAAASASATNSSNSAAAALVSQNAAAASATTSTSQAVISTTKAGESAASAVSSASSATSSAGSATAAAASFDQFNDIYLGAKSSAPSVDNDGNALQAGALYFNTVSDTMFVYSGSSWTAAGSAVNGTAERQEYTATSGQTSFNATYDVGFVDVYLNGSRLVPQTDFTATNGSQVVLTIGATTGDNVGIIAYGAFDVANVYTQAQSNARYAQLSNNLSDLASAPTALTNLGLTATAAELNVLDGVPATLTATELGYVDGVTSAIQTQLNAKPSGLSDLGITASATELNYNDITTLGTSQASKVLTADANGDVLVSEEFKAKSYNETYVAMAANDVDCETGNFFSKTISANTTFTFSNPPASGTAYGFVLQLTVSGTITVTWPSAVDWAGGSAPDAPASGETDILCFITRNGGTTWYGFLGGDALA